MNHLNIDPNWPINSLAIHTERLALRVPREDDIEKINALLQTGVQAENTPEYSSSWLYIDKSNRINEYIKDINTHYDNWKPDHWNLPLAVLFEDKPIGMQYISHKPIGNIYTFGSGMWVGLEYQNKGFATEMGRAVLKFGFETLNASTGFLGAWSDNKASLRVIEKLGYKECRRTLAERSGEQAENITLQFSGKNYIPEKYSDINIKGVSDSIIRLLGLT